MKLSITIDTAIEQEYLTQEERGENYKGSGYRLLNPQDKGKTPESIRISVNGFNYDGSLAPLSIIINEFLKESMVDVAVDKATKKAIAEVKKLK